MELINFLATINDACDAIPSAVFNLTSMIIFAIQVIVPVLLIIWGMIDFVKSVIGGDETKIKEGQKVFIKRLIAAIVVFLIVTIVKLVVNLVGKVTDNETGAGSSTNVWTCVEKFIKGSDK